ncbi:MAG: hypothetical protein KGR68_03765 [Betaproteobacteria bacterium]|nr:hypothetical protein [Betaproteobacteria bacterium]
MSGFQPVQVPDFGATLGRAQAYGINQLAALAQMRQLRQQQQYEDALQNPEVLSGILGADPAASANALTILAQRGGPMGFQAAMPLIRQDRENAQLTAVLGSLGGGGGAMPAAMPAAPPQGAPWRPAAMPGSPVGQPPLAPPDAVLPTPGGGMPRQAPGVPAASGPVMPQQAGVPSFEGLWRIAQAGPRGMEIATKLAPLVAQMNPNLATFNQGGRVWLQNPRTGARVDMGPVDATAEATRTINGQTYRGQEINGRFTPYPGQEAPPGYRWLPDGTQERVPGSTAESSNRQENFGNANTLRDEFNQLTAEFRVTQRAHDTLVSVSRDPSPAGDLSLLYQFNKLLDPNSVVRESEFATAARTGSLDQRVGAAVLRVLNGERLTVEQRADFVRQADLIAEAQRRSYTRLRDQYSGIARRAGIPVDQVIVDHEGPPQQRAAPTQGGGRFATMGPADLAQVDVSKLSAAEHQAYQARIDAILRTGR